LQLRKWITFPSRHFVTT